MKVLIIYPNKVMVTRMPLGLVYLASRLKKDKHEVRIFDTTFYKCSDISGDDALREASLQVKNPDLGKYGLVGEETDVFARFLAELSEFNPDIVGISATDPNYDFGLDFLKLVKRLYPSMPTIVGGPTPTVTPDEVIVEDCVDMICIGEAEEAFSELCHNLENKKDIKDIRNIWVKDSTQVYKNPIRELQELNEIPAPDLSLLDYRHFMRPLGGRVYRMATVMWTRGCMFHCKYCANSAYVDVYKDKGTFYRIKSPGLFVEELRTIKEKFNLNFLFFVDDIFPLHKKDVIDEFCRLYEEKVDLPFSMNLHPSLITKEQLKKVIDIGCVNICVGLESGSSEIRSEVLGRNYSDDKIVEIFQYAKSMGIRSSSFNMIGLPHETREDIMKTIELNRRAAPTSATLTFFHPYRGTTLREVCLEENLFDTEKEKDTENVYRAESHLNLPQISKEELRGLFNTFQLYFKLPKEYYDKIKIAEKDTEEGRKVKDEILKPLFEELTKDEMDWDFLQRRESWKKLI